MHEAVCEGRTLNPLLDLGKFAFLLLLLCLLVVQRTLRSIQLRLLPLSFLLLQEGAREVLSGHMLLARHRNATTLSAYCRITALKQVINGVWKSC